MTQSSMPLVSIKKKKKKPSKNSPIYMFSECIFGKEDGSPYSGAKELC